jgi:hypothetical protein
MNGAAENAGLFSGWTMICVAVVVVLMHCTQGRNWLWVDQN